jgi:hypothetical protein
MKFVDRDAPGLALILIDVAVTRAAIFLLSGLNPLASPWSCTPTVTVSPGTP